MVILSLVGPLLVEAFNQDGLSRQLLHTLVDDPAALDVAQHPALVSPWRHFADCGGLRFLLLSQIDLQIFLR